MVSVVSIATRPRVGQSGVRIPVGASDCSVLQGVMTGCGGPPYLFSVGGSVFPGGKATGREVNQSPPSIAEVKIEWSCTSSSLIHLHDLNRINV